MRERYARALAVATREPIPPETPPAPRNLLTIAEVATRLRISARTARRMAKSGELPALRITTRVWLIDEAELTRWLDERKAPVAGADDERRFRRPEAWQ